MKSLILQPALMLALTFGLCGCGGKTVYVLGGTISGLRSPSMAVLTLTNSNNGDVVHAPNPSVHEIAAGTNPIPDVAIAPDFTFTFAKTIEYGQTYNITVSTQPDHQACAVVNGLDSAGRTAAISVSVVCLPISQPLSGTITGLPAGYTLVLANGTAGGSVSVPADAAGAPVSFAMANVVYGSSYGITVVSVSNPTLGAPAVSCTVDNTGVGTMRDTPVTTVGVLCH